MRGPPMVYMMVMQPIHWFFVVIALVATVVTLEEQMAALRWTAEKPANPERKLTHMTLGLMPVLYFLPVPWWSVPLAWSLGFLLAWQREPQGLWKHLLWVDGDGQQQRIPDVGILAFPTVMLWGSLFMMASGHTMLLGMLAFGDGASSLLGQRYRGPALPWNPHKTWVGLLAFVIFGGGMGWFAGSVAEYSGAGMYWGQLTPGGPLWWGVALVLAVVESLPTRIDDNLRIGLAFGVLWSMLQ